MTRTQEFEKQTKIKLTLKKKIFKERKIATMTKSDNTTRMREKYVIREPKKRSG